MQARELFLYDCAYCGGYTSEYEHRTHMVESGLRIAKT